MGITKNELNLGVTSANNMPDFCFLCDSFVEYEFKGMMLCEHHFNIESGKHLSNIFNQNSLDKSILNNQR
ncbi:hypothetical protein P3G55_20100 [Leptospira sp. 96542]|nr:hypothetical protein [Leptospira sp. 96542]